MQLFAKLQITGAREFVTVKGSIAHPMATFSGYGAGRAISASWVANTSNEPDA